jgi:hypothetical protein
VAVHDFAEGFGVGRAAGGGLEDGGYLAEVGGAEDAGSDDGEGSGGQARQGAPRGEVGYMLRTTSGRWTTPRGMTRESPGGGFVALGFARAGPEGEGERVFEGVQVSS